MMFLPRSPEDDANVGPEKIVLKTAMIQPNTFELVSEQNNDQPQYEKFIEVAAKCTEEGDRLYLAFDWVGKKECIVLATNNIDTRIKCIMEHGLKLKIIPIENESYELTHEFIRDRSEFELIADKSLDCVMGNDRLYVGIDWIKKTNCIIYITNDPLSRQKCLDVNDISLQAD